MNFLGPTDEQAFEGKKSFKLDVVIKSGSYHYWGLPVRVPCAGRLKLSARMLVAEGNTAHVGFGTNFVFPPTHHSGCGALESFSKPTGQWRRIECDLVARGQQSAAGVMASHAPSVRGDEVGAVLDRWAIFVTGSEGQRAVVYLDDVRIEGETPSQQEYDADVQQRWAQGKERFQNQLRGLRADIAAGEEALAKTGNLSGLAEKAVQSARGIASQARSLSGSTGPAGLRLARRVGVAGHDRPGLAPRPRDDPGDRRGPSIGAALCPLYSPSHHQQPALHGNVSHPVAHRKRTGLLRLPGRV